MYDEFINLDILMEEQQSVRQKISTIMRKLKEWFLSKIDELGELLRHVKSSIGSALRNIKNKDGKLDKDIGVKGETVIPKGTPISSVTNSLQSDMNNLQITTKIVIQDCKDGIHYVDNDNKDKAVSTKHKVMDKIKNISLIVTPIMAGVLALTLYKKNESERRDFERKVNRMKADMKADLKADLKADMKAEREAEKEAEMYTDLVSNVAGHNTKDDGNVGSVKRTAKLVYKVLDKLDKKGMI